MKVTVLAFGHYRDLLPEPIQIEVPPGTTPRGVAAQLGSTNAKLAGLDQHCRVAVNEEYSSFDTVLNFGDEVAFIPPMSGG